MSPEQQERVFLFAVVVAMYLVSSGTFPRTLDRAYVQNRHNLPTLRVAPLPQQRPRGLIRVRSVSPVDRRVNQRIAMEAEESNDSIYTEYTINTPPSPVSAPSISLSMSPPQSPPISPPQSPSISPPQSPPNTPPSPVSTIDDVIFLTPSQSPSMSPPQSQPNSPPQSSPMSPPLSISSAETIQISPPLSRSFLDSRFHHFVPYSSPSTSSSSVGWFVPRGQVPPTPPRPRRHNRTPPNPSPPPPPQPPPPPAR